MKKAIAALLSSSISVCMASTPATTAEVDAAAAALQTQINTLNAIPAVAHPIGSCYGGGVVIYVNTTPGAPAGQQGLIAKLQDSTTGCSGGSGTTCSWANSVPSNFGTLAGYFTGKANTNLIRGGLVNTQAANAAYDATPSADCPTCTNWYLPSQYELYIIYAQSLLVGNTLWTNCGGTPPTTATTPNYWSSTQTTLLGNSALITTFTTGNASFATVTNALHVRAVRAF